MGLIGLLTFTFATIAEASTPYSKIIRNDDGEINKCIDDYGRIIYCTGYDRKNADEMVMYPHKYWTVEEKLVNKTDNLSYAEKCRNAEYAVSNTTSLIYSIQNMLNMIFPRK